MPNGLKVALITMGASFLLTGGVSVASHYKESFSAACFGLGGLFVLIGIILLSRKTL